MSAPLGPHGPALHGGPGRAGVRTRSVVGDGSGGREAVAHRSGAVRSWDAVRRLRHPLAAALAPAALVAALGVTDPYRPGGHPVCPVLALTGFYCAGCGAQRAVHDLAHLDVAAAWGMNPLVVLAVPLAVLLWARWVRRWWSGPATALAPAAPQAPAPASAPAALPADGLPARPVARPPEARPTTAWLLLAVVVTFAVLRNVPVLQPWLAP